MKVLLKIIVIDKFIHYELPVDKSYILLQDTIFFQPVAKAYNFSNGAFATALRPYEDIDSIQLNINLYQRAYILKI